MEFQLLQFTQSTNVDLDDKVISFFHEAKRELGISSTLKIARLTSNVLAAMRKGLTLKECDEVIAKLPSLLQLLFIKNWRHEDVGSTTFNHLDELVEVVYRDDRRSNSPIFLSEIYAMNAVIFILRKLDKLIGLLNFKGFRFSLVQEVRQVALEDAA